MRAMARPFLLGVAFAVQGVLLAATARCETITLSGSDWRIHDDVDGAGQERGLTVGDMSGPGWIPATVPGNIQADLEAAHVLEPLWYGDGDERLYDVAEKDWWYRKDFTVPASYGGKRLSLVFDGVDHECEVWLNGERIGAHAGMFLRFSFDVTQAIQVGRNNQLAVRVSRVPPKLAGLLRSTDGSGVGSIFTGGLHATRKQLKHLKSPTNWGWDWGVNIWTLGIWKDVRLEATGPARLEWMRVQTELSEDHSTATVIATMEVGSTLDLPARAKVRVSGHGKTVEATVDAALKPGGNVLRAEMTLDEPALWWPHGQGEQPLYELTAELSATRGAAVSDSRTVRFGVRDIEWVHTQGASADSIFRFQLVMNGRPVRMMGSNLIPPDLLYGRMQSRTRDLIRRAQEAGMNTLRLWGGGVILHDDAYDLADELGIMLLQGLPFANSLPETDPEFLGNLEATVRNIVRQVRNHPSIVEFDGGNEMPWNSRTKHPAYLLMKRIVTEDAGRMFRATCPDRTQPGEKMPAEGATHGPWYMVPRGGIERGDFLPTMRAGEFGSSSPANLEVWYREIPVPEQWPIRVSPVLVRKNVVRAVFLPDYWLRKAYLDDLFGPAEDLDELVETGQYLGAHTLRAAIDGLRRQGVRVGGMTTWDMNEPWPNGAGSYLVDYDGRPLMNFDFVKQAYAPISISLKTSGLYEDPTREIRAEVVLVSDAPARAEGVRWKWVARDRRGTVFAANEGTAAIAPLEVLVADTLSIKPPAQTMFGPLLFELRLEDAAGKVLTERLHILGVANCRESLSQLVRSDARDPDDDPSQLQRGDELPQNRGNALVNTKTRIKSMTAPAASTPPSERDKSFVNDGFYGDDHAWSDGWFEAVFEKPLMLGRFKFGRDRTGMAQERCVDFMKIEASLDGERWQTVFERGGLTTLPGFSPAKTVEIRVPPVEARHLRVTVVPPGANGNAPHPVLDEFEAYSARAGAPAEGPTVTVLDRPDVARPLRKTTLDVSAAPVRVEGEQEVLELTVKNTGPMTAFPVEPHPLISYRTDLIVDNNHCFVPPGESRTITIRADRRAACGLSLAQTGWWISAWNADKLTVPPSADVLFAVGRRDRMCREFLGYFDPQKATAATGVVTSADPSQVAYLVDAGKQVRFEFDVPEKAAGKPVTVRLHTSDQSKEIAAAVAISLNGRSVENTLPTGLGMQKENPQQLAYAASLEFSLPAGSLKAGTNTLDVKLANDGWFTWDSLEIITDAPSLSRRESP